MIKKLRINRMPRCGSLIMYTLWLKMIGCVNEHAIVFDNTLYKPNTLFIADVCITIDVPYADVTIQYEPKGFAHPFTPLDADDLLLLGATIIDDKDDAYKTQHYLSLKNAAEKYPRPCGEVLSLEQKTKLQEQCAAFYNTVLGVDYDFPIPEYMEKPK